MSPRIKRFLSGCFFLVVVGGTISAWGAELPPGSWRFAVAGDSRNCGDVVMPAIAKSVVAQQPKLAFYWHLGDFRILGSSVDEDMQAEYGSSLTAEEYRRIAWGDFIAHQIAPFGSMQVFLGIGNHELYKSQDNLLTQRQNAELSRAEFLKQFAFWLDSPPVRQGRGYGSGAVKTYYHWTNRNVEFINLDNADGGEAFDDEQLNWLSGVLDHDRADQQVRSVVVGMHRALPNSLACGHSMNGDLKTPDLHGTSSGRIAYEMMARWHKETGRPVYVLASHSHFVMAGVFETPYWKNRNEVLPGWVVGTAGAQRYMLPGQMPAAFAAEPATYGYLLGTVKPDGAIELEFQQLTESAIPDEIVSRYGKQFVHWCFTENRSADPHDPPASCNDQ